MLEKLIFTLINSTEKKVVTVESIIKACGTKGHKPKQVQKALDNMVQQGVLRTSEKKKIYALLVTKYAAAKKKSLKLGMFKLFSLIISVTCMVVSVTYSYMWLVQILPFTWMALLLSISLVGSGVLFFEGSILLWKKTKFFSVVFFLIWVVVTIFSITSSLAGQFDTFEDKFGKSVATQTQDIYSDKVSFLKDKLSLLQSEEKVLSKALVEENNADNRYLLMLKRREINKTISELDKATEGQITLASENKEVVKRNFFDLLVEIFGGSSGFYYFIIAFLPAIFIDIVAPLGVATFLFIED